MKAACVDLGGGMCMCFKLTDLKLPSWKKKFPSLYILFKMKEKTKLYLRTTLIVLFFVKEEVHSGH